MAPLNGPTALAHTATSAPSTWRSPHWPRSWRVASMQKLAPWRRPTLTAPPSVFVGVAPPSRVPPDAMNPNSRFHLAFNIGYPNAYDRAHGRTGSFIMIHGSTVSIGCLAMTDEKIEEIYTLCDAAHQGGQPYFRVHIFPFRMTPERMASAARSPHFPFWQNLKTGYDLFEQNRIPPNVSVDTAKKEYTFD